MMAQNLLIVENNRLADGIFRMTLHSPEMCRSAQPGQFFHIRVDGHKFPLLRRPISLCYKNPDSGYIAMVYRVQGQGTWFMSRQQPGQQLDVLGPLGNGFYLDKGFKRVLLVGGGMGTAPLTALAGVYGKKAVALLGYADHPFLIQEFEARCERVMMATEDGSCGYHGYVTDLLPDEIERQRPDIVYCCGPAPMMRKVAGICNKLSIRCQLSMEQRMGCGIGACLVCSCATKIDGGQVGYSRVCKDGPVFWSEEVIFDE
jgi:dihydroorotate dehydrogenase electron transfer subunit